MRRICILKVTPEPHWQKLWSNRPPERSNEEIRCRTDVVGIFPNRLAAGRLVGVVLAEQHDEWTEGRRCLNIPNTAGCEAMPPHNMLAPVAGTTATRMTTITPLDGTLLRRRARQDQQAARQQPGHRQPVGGGYRAPVRPEALFAFPGVPFRPHPPPIRVISAAEKPPVCLHCRATLFQGPRWSQGH